MMSADLVPSEHQPHCLDVTAAERAAAVRAVRQLQSYTWETVVDTILAAIKTERLGRRQVDSTDSITCPRCTMTSYNPNDIEMGYCGNCHAYTVHAGEC